MVAEGRPFDPSPKQNPLNWQKTRVSATLIDQPSGISVFFPASATLTCSVETYCQKMDANKRGLTLSWQFMQNLPKIMH